MKIVAKNENRRRRLFFLFTFVCLGIIQTAMGQNTNSLGTPDKVSRLFQSEEVLSIRMRYSSREVRSKTNDSTYISTSLAYMLEDGSWDSLEVRLRGRGNFRRNNCYFTPIKLKIDKSASAGTLFEGNKKLKLVLPCFRDDQKYDNILKEYIAYKLYEQVSPYHFKTRLVRIDFEELRSAKTRSHQLLGILIEDTKKLAKRHDGHVIKRSLRALGQDAMSSVRNNMFNFMIGNTDYSTTYQHNQKLLFIDKKLIPVPYDFDMSGLVDASYAVVSNVQNLRLNISEVTERMYKGYERDPKVYEQVRTEFINNKAELMKIVDEHQAQFNSQRAFATAKKFLLGFFNIVESDTRFNKDIIAYMRS
ncbi:MAG: hypothetical protein AB3N14_01975 [Flavobacteriaceae bacterium]